MAVTPEFLLESTAVAASLAGVWLTARRALAGWPVSLIACGLYALVFFNARLYADMTLQGFFCLGILHGWHSWARERKQASDRIPSLAIRSLTWPKVLSALGVTLAGAWLWALILRHTDDPLPFLDALLSSASLLGQFWMACRYRASWLLWIVVDSVYVGLFASRHLDLTALLYACFTLMAVYGWRQWCDLRPELRTGSGREPFNH
ncbi:nicotinamide riboside transporter PnuC [Oecophyllibacter saccharovorans]|uniref:nicotinamide riboside transporter PnuC n=1 Tax=Oecophyllibacter saccharovorans TaxID=2558360 RepID=UPI0011443C70|nr:nicotinamide riboside transporter PnuC [Oecophyllibacter saccharovorans]QDH15236.1 nicotinamide riboside transporter PnuC [Oecophyllibacter saccharovorans]